MVNQLSFQVVAEVRSLRLISARAVRQQLRVGKDRDSQRIKQSFQSATADQPSICNKLEQGSAAHLQCMLN